MYGRLFSSQMDLHIKLKKIILVHFYLEELSYNWLPIDVRLCSTINNRDWKKLAPGASMQSKWQIVIVKPKILLMVDYDINQWEKSIEPWQIAPWKDA